MDPESLSQLTHILQLSITPVALISGVGLLLLSMTNRLGRVIDRSRQLGREMQGMSSERESRESSAALELRILFRRARLLQLAIAMIATSIFLAVLMVVALFAMHLLAYALSSTILLLFGVCLACMVASLGCFLADIFLSIRWLHVSLGRYV